MRANIFKKGVSGKILTVIISLIIAIIALILLWDFLREAYPLITQGVENMISAFKKMLCEQIPFLNWPILKGMFGC